MEERLGPWLVWLRASFVGSVFVLLGVVGHVSADGLLPGAVAMTGLLAVSVTLAGVMLVRPASTARLVTMLVSGQLVVHVVLSATAGHRGEHRATGALAGPALHRPAGLPSVDGRRVGSMFDAYQVAPAQQSSSMPTLPVGDLMGHLTAHAPMMLAHIAAAALVGVWLAWGERSVLACASLAGRQLLVIAAWPPPLVPWRAPRLAHPLALPVLTLRSLWQCSPPSGRGPPPRPRCPAPA